MKWLSRHIFSEAPLWVFLSIKILLHHHLFKDDLGTAPALLKHANSSPPRPLLCIFLYSELWIIFKIAVFNVKKKLQLFCFVLTAGENITSVAVYIQIRLCFLHFQQIRFGATATTNLRIHFDCLLCKKKHARALLLLWEKYCSALI